MKFDLERILLRTPFVKDILAEKNQKISHFAKEYSKRRAVDLIFKPENEINKVEENILRGYYSAVGCDGARYFRISYEKGIPEVGRVIGIDKMHDSENIFEDTYPSRITEKDKLSGRILPYVVLNKKIYHLDLRSSNFKDHLYCFPLDESNSLIKNNAGEIERFEEKIGEPIIQKILANSNHSGVKEKYELPLIEEFEDFDGEKHRRCMGVLVSDNTFSDHSIDAHRLETMIFTSQTAATRLSGARLMDKYKSEASFDYLTGFYKKKTFEEEMAKRIHSALRYGHIFSVAMLDIDYFKPINDTYGHLAGDGILKTVSSLIKNTIRNYDLPSRWGGEEFAIIFPMTDKEGASKAVESVRRTIAAYNFKDILEISKDKYITISGGLAEFKDIFIEERNKIFKEDGRRVLPEEIAIISNDLVRYADLALYRAKDSGRNRVCLYAE